MPADGTNSLEYPENRVKEFITALAKTRERGGKIFSTRFVYGGKNFLLTTTSKDLNLSLSEMSDESLAALCNLLWEGFLGGGRQILLIDPEPKPKKALLFMRMEPEPGSSAHHVYHLSPA